MKPADFYLGASEFISVFIPGFLLTSFGLIVFDPVCKLNFTFFEWAILATISYVFGHLLYSMGALLDNVNDKFKPQKDDDPLLKLVGQIRAELTSDASPNEEIVQTKKKTINRYKWCRAILSSLHSEGYSEVLRKEADSKLFRSLVLPFLFSALAVWFCKGEWEIALALLVFLTFSFNRYRHKRFKACDIAYTHCIVLNQLGKLGKPIECDAEDK